MSNSLAALQPFFRPWARDLVNLASRAGVQPRVTSTLRTHTYQARLYRDYLAGRNAYPVAPPGASAHELGLAFDIVTHPMSALEDLGSVWEEWGGVWGGRFGDEVHFEFPGASQHAAHSYEKIKKFANEAGGLALPLSATVAEAVLPESVIGKYPNLDLAAASILGPSWYILKQFF